MNNLFLTPKLGPKRLPIFLPEIKVPIHSNSLHYQESQSSDQVQVSLSRDQLQTLIDIVAFCQVDEENQSEEGQISTLLKRLVQAQ